MAEAQQSPDVDKAKLEPPENKRLCANCGEDLTVKTTQPMAQNYCRVCGYEWPHNLPLRMMYLERRLDELEAKLK